METSLKSSHLENHEADVTITLNLILVKQVMRMLVEHTQDTVALELNVLLPKIQWIRAINILRVWHPHVHTTAKVKAVLMSQWQ